MNKCKVCNANAQLVYKANWVAVACTQCLNHTSWHNLHDDQICIVDSSEGAKMEWDRDNQPPEPRRKQV